MKLNPILMLVLVGCATDSSDVVSWEEFQARAYHEPETGLYIMNGDEPVKDLGELRAMYERYVDQADGFGTTTQYSIVHQANGGDSKWTPAQAVNLTYCIKTGGGFLGSLQGSFNATRYAQVKAAMDGATADWEGVGRVNYIHLSAHDTNCTTSNTAVTFNVRQVTTGGQYVASAFFPDYARAQREVKIDTSAFGDLSPWTLRGILRHELGHTLGFRHEHTRPEAGTCFEDNSWRALTAYDAASVMHYPHCNGSQTGDLVITALDATGARTLYP